MRRILNKHLKVARFFPFLLLIGTFVLFVFSDFFKIKSIVCKTQYGQCEPKDEALLGEFKGKNLFFLSTKSVLKKTQGNFSNRRVFVQKIFPNSLVVALEKRKAAAGLSLGLAKQGIFLIDVDGKVISFVNESKLPVILLDNGGLKLAVGGSVDEKTLAAVRILSLVYNSQPVSLSSMDGEDFVVDLTNGAKVYFPLNQDSEALVGALQLILSRSRIDGKIPKTIDLRFSNPVLRY